MHFLCFLCAACLPASLIMHVPVSELHLYMRNALHWFLHFSMSLNSRCFLQFHPSVMLMAYVNSCFIIIRQNFFPVSSFSSGISYNSRTTACRVSIGRHFCRTDRNLCSICVFMKIKGNGWTFYFKTRYLVLIYVFSVLLVKNIRTKIKITKNQRQYAFSRKSLFLIVWLFSIVWSAWREQINTSSK